MKRMTPTLHMSTAGEYSFTPSPTPSTSGATYWGDPHLAEEWWRAIGDQGNVFLGQAEIMQEQLLTAALPTVISKVLKAKIPAKKALVSIRRGRVQQVHVLCNNLFQRKPQTAD